MNRSMREGGGGRGRYSLRLRSIMGLFGLGVLALPFAFFSLARLAFTGIGASSGDSLARDVAVSAAIQSAISTAADGSLVASRAPSIPSWLELAVVDEKGTVLLSTFPGLEPGSGFSAAAISRDGKLFAPGTRYTVDTISSGDRAVGAAVARFPVRDLSIRGNRALPFIAAFIFLGIALVAFSLGVFLAARMASPFAALSAAAKRMADGDLDCPVPVKGPREIASLARDMESMREALREDRARRSRFLASVSHDLRTPLTSIKGYLEALEDGMAGDDETRGRYLSIMETKASLLEERISELLAFARMMTGEWRLTLAPVDMGEFLARLAAVFETDARAARRGFDADLGAAEGVIVTADRKLLSRALENILSNALRYAPEGAAVRLACARAPDCLTIHVDDRGPGIPEGDLERIFEPYFRGTAATGEGEGLGLSIARSIMRDHGGDIAAQNLPAGGCRFTATLPLSSG